MKIWKEVARFTRKVVQMKVRLLFGLVYFNGRDSFGEKEKI